MATKNRITVRIVTVVSGNTTDLDLGEAVFGTSVDANGDAKLIIVSRPTEVEV